MKRKIWGFFNLSLSVGLAGAAVYFLTAYQSGFENDARPSNSNIPGQSELVELVSEAKEVAKSTPSRSTIAWRDAAIDIMKQTNTRTLTFSYEPASKPGFWSPEDVRRCGAHCNSASASGKGNGLDDGGLDRICGSGGDCFRSGCGVAAWLGQAFSIVLDVQYMS